MTSPSGEPAPAPEAVEAPEGAAASEGRTLRRDALIGTLVNGSGIGLGLLSQIVLAKALTIEGYGIYTYVVTLLGLTLLAVRHGWDMVLIRFLATYREEQAWGALRGLLRRGVQLPLGVALLAGVGMSAVGWALGTPFGAALVVGGPVLVAWTALTLCSGVLVGLGRVVLGSGIQSFGRPAVFLAILSALWLLRPDERLDGSQTLVLYGLSMLAALAWGSGAAWRALRRLPLGEAAPEPRTDTWVRIALPLALAVAADLLLRRTDVLVVGILRDTTDAGIYRVGALGAELCAIVVVAVEMALLPRCARRFAAGDLPGLRSLVQLASLTSALSTALSALALWLLGELLLGWLRPEFLPAYRPLVVLCWGLALGQLFGPTRSLAMMTGQQRAAAWTSAIGCALNLALNFALVPRWGLLGAAWATAVTLAITRSGLWLHLRLAIGVDSSVFAALLPAPREPEWTRPAPASDVPAA